MCILTQYYNVCDVSFVVVYMLYLLLSNHKFLATEFAWKYMYMANEMASWTSIHVHVHVH